MKYLISRNVYKVNGYTQINTPAELKALPKNTEVMVIGAIPFIFLKKEVMLSIAQERNLTIRVLQSER